MIWFHQCKTKNNDSGLHSFSPFCLSACLSVCLSVLQGRCLRLRVESHPESPTRLRTHNRMFIHVYRTYVHCKKTTNNASLSGSQGAPFVPSQLLKVFLGVDAKKLLPMAPVGSSSVFSFFLLPLPKSCKDAFFNIRTLILAAFLVRDLMEQNKSHRKTFHVLFHVGIFFFMHATHNGAGNLHVTSFPFLLQWLSKCS